MVGLVDFGVDQYVDPLLEARACRESCALFDFSFISVGELRGDASLEVLHEFQPRNITSLRSGQVRFSVVTDRLGAVQSDLTLWKLSAKRFQVYSGRAADIAFLQSLNRSGCTVSELSKQSAIFSLQGPASLTVLSEFADLQTLKNLPYFGHANIPVSGRDCLIGRLGFSGEKGFELVIQDLEWAKEIWANLSSRVQTGGMIAADMLRIEAGFPLFTNECRLGATPSELGLGRFISQGGGDDRFALVAFRGLAETALPYAAPEIVSTPRSGEILVTSANRSNLVPGILGLGLVRYPFDPTAGLIDPSQQFHQISLQSRPFYDPTKSIPGASW